MMTEHATTAGAASHAPRLFVYVALRTPSHYRCAKLAGALLARRFCLDFTPSRIVAEIVPDRPGPRPELARMLAGLAPGDVVAITAVEDLGTPATAVGAAMSIEMAGARLILTTAVDSYEQSPTDVVIAAV